MSEARMSGAAGVVAGVSTNAVELTVAVQLALSRARSSVTVTSPAAPVPRALAMMSPA